MQLLIGSFSKLIAFIIWSLPRRVQLALGNLVGWLWFDVLRICRQIAIDNVTIAFPALPEKERVAIARSSLHNMGNTLMEFFWFPFINQKNARGLFVLEGEEKLRAAVDQGKGVILLCLHLGNGDLALTGLSEMGYPINLISKEFKAKWLNELWFGMRRKHGTKFIPPEKSSFEILRALKRKEIVVFVLDQYMGPPVGVRTNFFGKVTGTAAGCALMADRTHAPVVPSYTYRKPDGTPVMVFDDPIPFQDHGQERSERDKNIAAMTQVYTDKIESIVRKHPGQWMWIHRRWKEFRD